MASKKKKNRASGKKKSKASRKAGDTSNEADVASPRVAAPLNQQYELPVISSPSVNHEAEEDLFEPVQQEECPLCFFPMPLVPAQSTYSACCGTQICGGCYLKHAAIMQATNDERISRVPPLPPIDLTCAFCRAKSTGVADSDQLLRCERRMAENDPEAIKQLAHFYHEGMMGLRKDEKKAFQLFQRAAELGHTEAYYFLSLAHEKGFGGAEKSQSKQLHYLKMAAKGGNATARYSLGVAEMKKGRAELAVKHWMFAAARGDDCCLNAIKMVFLEGDATKGQFEEALRANQKAKGEATSDEREQFVEWRAADYDWSIFTREELADLKGIREKTDR